MKPLVILSLIACLASCGSATHTVSTLQRFQSLKAKLSAATDEDKQTAFDVTRLNLAFSHGRASKIDSRALALAKRSTKLIGSVRLLAKDVRALLRSRPPSVVRNFFRITSAALTSEGKEGTALHRAAVIIRSDHWLMNPRDVGRLEANTAKARRQARLAVALTREAQSWKRRHRAAFRFVTVKGSA